MKIIEDNFNKEKFKKTENIYTCNNCMSKVDVDKALAELETKSQGFTNDQLKVVNEELLKVKSELGKMGIKEVIVWECTVKEMKRNERRKAYCLRKIKRIINEGTMYLEV